MRSAEPLITADSSYHNYEPSRTARLYWLYPLCAGYFTYQKGYHLERASYDSWLLEVILDGEAIIQTKGKTYVAQAGDIVLLDCHKQHGYSSQTGWKALWVHFDGISAQGYADMIVPQNPVIRHPRAGDIVQSIQIIYDMLATPSPEKEADTVEITDALNTSGKTEITVSADNGFSDHALPYSRSFDWANDGGLFRPVECRSTGRICLWDLEVTAQPVILPTGKRQNQGQAVFGFRHVLDGARSGDTLQWSLHAGAADSMEAMEDAPLLSGTLHPDEAFAPCVLRDI